MTSELTDPDRREFLGRITLSVGGVVVASMVPLSGAVAVTDIPVTAGDLCAGDWTIDDMCGAYPPYAHPIPYGRPLVETPAVADLEGVDPILLLG